MSRLQTAGTSDMPAETSPAAPDAYAVMGNPIAHSLSPQIHAAFARETRQHLTYTAILVPREGFAQALERFQAAGGKGLNITLPFKHEAWQRAHRLSPRAQQAGAVNTLVFQADGTRFGDNTDGSGLLRDILDNHGGVIAGRRVLLLGAGGAARGVLAPLLEQRPAALVIANRTPEKALTLAVEFRSLGPVAGCGYAELGARSFHLVINGTSASLAGQVPALPGGILAPGAWCYDMAYAEEPTAFVRWGERHGAARSLDGLGMLVEQAAESFLLWRGVRPDTAPVIASLKRFLAANGRQTVADP